MMIIAANVAFAIAAVLLGQLFVLRRRAAPTVAVLRFAPNFDAAPGGALRAAEATAAAATSTTLVASTTSLHDTDAPAMHAGAAESDQDDPRRPEATTAGAEPAHQFLWPWERKARQIIDPAGHLSPVPDPLPVAETAEREQVAVDGSEVPPVPAIAAEANEDSEVIASIEPPEPLSVAVGDTAAHELVAPLAAAEAHVAEITPAPLPPDHVDADRLGDEAEDDLVALSSVLAPQPWWRRIFSRDAKPRVDPLAVNGLRLDEDDTNYAVVVPRDEEPPVPIAEPVATAVDEHEDDRPLLSDSLGLSPERRAEISAQYLLSAAAPHTDAVSSTTDGAMPVAADASAAADAETVSETPAKPALEPVSAPESAVSAADAARALAEAQMRASAWACEAANSSQPFSVEKRRRLLEYYAATISDPASRDIVARVEREDPDLAARAAEILRQAAA